MARFARSIGFIQSTSPVSRMALVLGLSGLLSLATPAHGSTNEQALLAAGADTLTTAVAISSGLVELNPLGPVGALLAKGVALGLVRTLPAEEQASHYNLMSSFWSGAAVNNLCWVAGGGPVCFLIGTFAGKWAWDSGESKRLRNLQDLQNIAAQSAAGSAEATPVSATPPAESAIPGAPVVPFALSD